MNRGPADTEQRLPWATVARRAAAFLAVAVCSAAALAQDGAGEAVGPAIGNNRYRGTIAPGARDVFDADPFTGSFLPGDLLSVAVTGRRARRGDAPTLRPVVELVDPLGRVRAPVVRVGAGGTSVSIRDHRIDRAGLWTVRVRGEDRSSGEFDVAFRVRPARKATSEGALGGERALEAVHTFPAFDGATLDAWLVASSKGGAVAFADLRSPTGAEVAGADGAAAVESAAARGHRAELRRVVLAPGTGEYTLAVRADEAASYRLTIAVTPPKRPASRKPAVLTADEPSLDPFDAPLVAPAGTTVRFAGAHFVARGATRVLFGGTPSPSVTVAPNGNWLDVVVPARTGPAVVAVTVVNPDGQGCVRAAHFAYVPGPAATDLLDLATGTPVRATSSLAGRAVRLTGRHLEPGQTIRIGDAAVPAVISADGFEARFALPVGILGVHAVTVTDAWGRGDAEGIAVEFKSPPSFAAAPFTPAVVAPGDLRNVTVRGTMFEPSDRWFLGDAEIATTYVDSWTRRFAMPPLPEGRLRVRIVDRVGTTVDGPDLRVKGPPGVTSVEIAGGAGLDGPTVPLVGGTAVRVTGTRFLADDVVTVGGAAVTTLLETTETTKVFVAPPGAVGRAALTILDGAGQSVTLPEGLRYAALVDASASIVPASSESDELAALRGAAGDLDGDGRADDVLLLSPSGASPRLRQPRVLVGGADGALTDATGQVVAPEAATVAATDGFDASCCVLADFDGQNGVDVAYGGRVADDRDLPLVRFLVGQGEGRFLFDATLIVPSSWAQLELNAMYGNSWVRVLDAAAQRGVPQAIAAGDIDGDGDPDLVVGTDAAMQQRVRYDLAYVDTAQVPARASQLVPVTYSRFLAGTHLYLNGIAHGQAFAEVSATRLPSVGTTLDTANPPAALVCRDLALADVDLDGDLDLVLAWDDPRSVSTAGFASRAGGGSGDAPRIATRVLLNEEGSFTGDATTTWMPQGSGAEFWQADRLALADLDADGDADLVLATRRGLDAHTGAETHTRTALRVLRNDRTHFTDVTATAVPAVSGDDDFRAEALAVADIDGDGRSDLLLGTTAELRTASGGVAPRFRALFGRDDLRFVAGAPFSEEVTIDSGEASGVVVLGANAGRADPAVLLLSETLPAASPAARRFVRAHTWRR